MNAPTIIFDFVLYSTGSIKGQECEIRLQSLRDLYLEDRNGDTQDQLDIHNKKFAGNYKSFNSKKCLTYLPG